jgi:hypothetical protein
LLVAAILALSFLSATTVRADPPRLHGLALEPEEGYPWSTIFRFEVSYGDSDGDPPFGGAPILWINESGESVVQARMDRPWSWRQDYVLETTLPPGLYTHTFSASDGTTEIYTEERWGPNVSGEVRTIRGQVHNKSGSPLHRAVVSIDDPPMNTTTDASGEFVFHEVFLGRRLMRAGAAGHANASFWVRVSESWSSSDQVNFTLTPLGHLQVVVEDEWGFPLDRANVILHTTWDWAEPELSDDNGIVELLDFPEYNLYYLDVTRRGFEAVEWHRVAITGFQTTSEVVNLTSMAGTVTVVVQNSEGDVLPGARISVSPRGVEWWNDNGVTDSRGVVRFHGTPGGERRVRVEAEGYETKILNVPIDPDEGIRLDLTLTPTLLTTVIRTAPFFLVAAGTVVLMYLFVNRWRRVRGEREGSPPEPPNPEA